MCLFSANGEALSLSAELIRIFVLGDFTLFARAWGQRIENLTDARRQPKEAINRAGKLAGDEESPVIEASHLQQILPQLLLDFS